MGRSPGRTELPPSDTEGHKGVSGGSGRVSGQAGGRHPESLRQGKTSGAGCWGRGRWEFKEEGLSLERGGPSAWPHPRLAGDPALCRHPPSTSPRCVSPALARAAAWPCTPETRRPDAPGAVGWHLSPQSKRTGPRPAPEPAEGRTAGSSPAPGEMAKGAERGQCRLATWPVPSPAGGQAGRVGRGQVSVGRCPGC